MRFGRLPNGLVLALALQWGLALGPIGLRAAEVAIRVEDSYFDPLQLAIQVGDTVVWSGYGAQDHTVTSDDSLFNSMILFGETFSYTFLEPGVYPYYCDNHGNAGGGGMSGSVVVSSGGANRAPTRPNNVSPSDGAINESLTLQLRASVFSDPDALDFHGASQWLVRRVIDNAVAFDSGEDAVNRTNCSVTAGALTNGATYVWQVRYRDGRGSWSVYSVPTTFTTLIPVVQTGVGLLAHYGNSTSTPALAITTNGTVHFDWGTTRPHRRITSDAFVARWEGSLLPEFSERYDIQFRYRGQARVWVDHQLLIDESNACGFIQSRHGFISLVAGQLVPIRVEYVATAEGGLASLRWSSPARSPQIIPAERLFPRPLEP